MRWSWLVLGVTVGLLVEACASTTGVAPSPATSAAPAAASAVAPAPVPPPAPAEDTAIAQALDAFATELDRDLAQDGSSLDSDVTTISVDAADTTGPGIAGALDAAIASLDGELEQTLGSIDLQLPNAP